MEISDFETTRMGPDTEWSSPLEFAIAARDGRIHAMVEDALARHDVALAYQPVIRPEAPDRPVFYEALIRIMDETGRIIPAKEFIDWVETTPTGREIDTHALALALVALRETPDLHLSVNLSARSIVHPGWTKVLETGLKADPSIAERLILEITESSAIELPRQVCDFMASLQDRGVTFALDDFGAGFTSFRYLREFYFDILKIDRQFIHDIGHNPDNQVLTAALLSIADHFDMVTVAEGVETREDAACLTALGVDCMQGYYFGAPTMRPPWKPEEKTPEKKSPFSGA